MGTTEAATAQPLLRLTQPGGCGCGVRECTRVHTHSHMHTRAGAHVRMHTRVRYTHTHTHSHTCRDTSNTHREGLRGRGAVRLQPVRFLRAGSNLASRVPAGAGPAPCLH